MKTSHLLILGFIFTIDFMKASAVEEGLARLNDVRHKSGLWKLNSSDALQKAAQNHSHYLQINNTSGHYEDDSKDGFTGKEAADRVVKVGYISTVISENISGGQSDINRSIDGLMGALYHRLTFLNFERDEIGIGVEGKHYTFDLGNSYLRELCLNHNYQEGNYYYHVCKDSDKKIEEEAFNEAKNQRKADVTAPNLVLWPPVNGDPVPPAFYNETPDPLPDDLVSGYPVSVQFNDARYLSVPENVSIEIQDDQNNTLDKIVQMGKNNDPHKRLTAYQFALFPEKHMEWGHSYYAILSFGDQTKRWCFTTLSLSDLGAERVYRIDTDADSTEFRVVSGRYYAFYFVPQNTKDILDGYKYTVAYRHLEPKVEINYLDRNTLLFFVEGEQDDKVTLDVNISYIDSITLIIGDEDTATMPTRAICAPTMGTDTDNGAIIPPNSTTPPSTIESSSVGGFPPTSFLIVILLVMIRAAERLD